MAQMLTQMRELDSLRPKLAVCGFSTPTGPAFILVLESPCWDVVLRMEADWDGFRPASARARLIERGWMVPSPVHGWPGRVGGWLSVPGIGWTAPVIPASHYDRPLPRCTLFPTCCGSLSHEDPCPVSPDDDAAVPLGLIPQHVRDSWVADAIEGARELEAERWLEEERHWKEGR